MQANSVSKEVISRVLYQQPLQHSRSLQRALLPAVQYHEQDTCPVAVILTLLSDPPQVCDPLLTAAVQTADGSGRLPVTYS
jgi:hypothetical protein